MVADDTLLRLVEHAVHHTSDGLIVMDADLQIMFVNAPAVEMVERSAEEMVGRLFWDVFPEAEDHELGESYRTAMSTGQSQHVEAYYGPLQGWFDVSSMPVDGGLILRFQSSDRRRRDEATQVALVARLEEALARQNQSQSVVTAYAETLSIEDVAAATMQLASGAMATMFAGVALLSDDGRTLQFVSLDPLPEATVAGWSVVPLDAPSALTDSVRLSQGMYHASRAELLATYPHLATTVEEAGNRAFVSVPLIVGRRTIGALSMSWAVERAFTEQDRSYIRMLAAQCAQAIERAQLIGRQRNVAETLQQAMLPDTLPTVEGAEISACYLPSTADLSVGGDWYDSFRLPNGQVVFAVGDVSGHGVQAAAVMGQIRNSLRAYLVEGHEPATALTMLDRLVDHAGHALFATVIAGVYDPGTGDLAWANAGHPPLILRGRREVRFLGGKPGAPIGVSGPLGYTNEHATLVDGDILVGYTDGLIERRREDITIGLDRLLASVSVATSDLRDGAWCHDLVDHVLGGGGRDDDICVLALQRVG